MNFTSLNNLYNESEDAFDNLHDALTKASRDFHEVLEMHLRPAGSPGISYSAIYEFPVSLHTVKDLNPLGRNPALSNGALYMLVSLPFGRDGTERKVVHIIGVGIRSDGSRMQYSILETPSGKPVPLQWRNTADHCAQALIQEFETYFKADPATVGDQKSPINVFV